MERTTIRPDTGRRHKNKYSNKNFLHRLTLERFFDVAAEMLKEYTSSSVLEFGCGEGLFLKKLRERALIFKNLTGIDLRADALSEAKSLHPEYTFINQDLLTWESDRKYELVIASQVLEHLYEPETYLEALVRKSSNAIFLTVPFEPWFRVMNFLRGRDILAFGNHPEHINWWGKKSFVKFLEPHCEIIEVRVSFPFLLVKAQVK